MQPRPETPPRHRRPDRRRRPSRAGTTLIVAALVISAFLTVAVLAASGSHPDRDQGPRDRAGVGLVAAPPGRPRPPGAAGASSKTGQRAEPRRAGPERGSTAALPARGAVVRAAAVLRAWDERRAEAWAEGDVTALRELYVDRAGVADVRLLRRYADRGYRVEGLTTQLLAVDVLERAPTRWLLRVTDRLTGAVAVRGEERLRLPRDLADTHVVTLVRASGVWRMAAIRPHPGDDQRRSE